ncbi:MAG: hypothetical protein WBE22_00495 [Halobacteriota archaeon]
MPELDDRIALWRNTIQLFHRYNRPDFVGPFKAIGLSYVVERPFLTKQGEERKPDIVASGESGWMILELTTTPGSKKPNLDRYKAIEPRYLSEYGLCIHDCTPDVLSSRLSSVDDGHYCQIIVKDILRVEKEECLNNQDLKNALDRAKGADLSKLPEIPVSIVPEQNSKSKELCRGLVDIVMQLFEPNSDGKTSIQLVDEGLERLSDKVGVTEKRRLMDKVNNVMEDLIKNHIPEYLELTKEGKYKATEKFKQHHKTMWHIASRLRDWAAPGPQKTWDDIR